VGDVLQPICGRHGTTGDVQKWRESRHATHLDAKRFSPQRTITSLDTRGIFLDRACGPGASGRESLLERIERLLIFRSPRSLRVPLMGALLYRHGIPGRDRLLWINCGGGFGPGGGWPSGEAARLRSCLQRTIASDLPRSNWLFSAYEKRFFDPGMANVCVQYELPQAVKRVVCEASRIS